MVFQLGVTTVPQNIYSLLDFDQLFVINSLFDVTNENKQSIPIVWVYMTSRHAALYENVFLRVRNMFAEFAPQVTDIHYISDDESGQYNSFQHIFAENYNLTFNLCWFHHNQATIRWLRTNGKAHYINHTSPKYMRIEENLKANLESVLLVVLRLVYLPANVIKPVLEYTEELAHPDLELGDFFNYLIRKMTPSHVIKISWYEHLKTTEKLERLDMTSNKLEAQHKSLTRYIGENSASYGTSFIMTVKLAREWLTSIYSDHEKYLDGAPLPLNTVSEKQQKRAKWAESWVKMIETRLARGSSLTTPANIKKLYEFLTKYKDF